VGVGVGVGAAGDGRRGGSGVLAALLGHGSEEQGRAERLGQHDVPFAGRDTAICLVTTLAAARGAPPHTALTPLAAAGLLQQGLYAEIVVLVHECGNAGSVGGE